MTVKVFTKERDVFVATDTQDSYAVFGNGGDDVIVTGNLTDVVWVGATNANGSVVLTKDGDDIVFTQGDVQVTLGNGNDHLFIQNPNAKVDITLDSLIGYDDVKGFSSNDTLSFSYKEYGGIGNGDSIIDNVSYVKKEQTWNSNSEVVKVEALVDNHHYSHVALWFIGDANKNIEQGSTKLFVVGNEYDTSVYGFISKNGDNVVDDSEIVLLARVDANVDVSQLLFV